MTCERVAIPGYGLRPNPGYQSHGGRVPGNSRIEGGFVVRFASVSVAQKANSKPTPMRSTSKLLNS